MKHFYFSLLSALTLALCAGNVAQAYAQAGTPAKNDNMIYGVMDNATNTLTLYYDDMISERGGSDDWGFDFCDDTETIVLDVSMKNARPTILDHWFELFVNLTKIEHLDYLNTSEVTEVFGLFQSCTRLETIDLSGLDLSHVTDPRYMFSECEALKTLNLGNLCNNGIEYTEGMFNGCKKLKTIDLSRMNMKKVSNSSEMFKDCESLVTIYCNADLTESEELEKSENMFLHCYNLKGGRGTAYNNLHVDAVYARPDGGYSAPGYFTTEATGMEEVMQQQPADSNARKVIYNGLFFIIHADDAIIVHIT